MFKQSFQRPRIGWVALGCLVLLAALNLGVGWYRGLVEAWDLALRYEEWTVLISRGQQVSDHLVDANQMQGWWPPYHPLTYLLLSPLFLLGLEPARVLFAVLNLAATGYAIWRAGRVFELKAMSHAWLAALFGCWWSVRVTLGQGQLGLIFLALLLAAFPFAGARGGWGLALGWIKHNLVFPLYAERLLCRPRQMLWPLVVGIVPILAACWWNGVSPLVFTEQTRQAAAGMLGWVGGTDLGSALASWSWPGAWRLGIVWSSWSLLFLAVLVLVRDERHRLAALLLLSLLPVYHRPYDLVVALPALAVFCRQQRWIWAGGMTLLLGGLQEFLVNRWGATWLVAEQWQGWYYPAVIGLVLAGLVVSDRATRSVTVNSS